MTRYFLAAIAYLTLLACSSAAPAPDASTTTTAAEASSACPAPTDLTNRTVANAAFRVILAMEEGNIEYIEDMIDGTVKVDITFPTQEDTAPFRAHPLSTSFDTKTGGAKWLASLPAYWRDVAPFGARAAYVPCDARCCQFEYPEGIGHNTVYPNRICFTGPNDRPVLQSIEGFQD